MGPESKSGGRSNRESRKDYVVRSIRSALGDLPTYKKISAQTDLRLATDLQLGDLPLEEFRQLMTHRELIRVAGYYADLAGRSNRIEVYRQLRLIYKKYVGILGGPMGVRLAADTMRLVKDEAKRLYGIDDFDARVWSLKGEEAAAARSKILRLWRVNRRTNNSIAVLGAVYRLIKWVKTVS